MHAASLRDEAGVLDVPDDLEFVHAQYAAPAARTTFSSIITEPMSLAPNARLSCPTFPPCVTHDDCRLSKLSRTRRAIASVRSIRFSRFGRHAVVTSELRVVGLEAPGDECREAAGFVLQVAQTERVLETLVERLDGAIIIVAVVRRPAWCACRMTPSHSSAVALP